MSNTKTIMVTGGAGFIGSAVIRELISHTTYHVVNVDKLTYAASPAALAQAEVSPRYRFVKADICDAKAMAEALTQFEPDVIMHLAAESHVDRSIDGPAAFISTNIVGTYTLLEAVRVYWHRLQSLQPQKAQHFRFHHVSTDEVFGDLEASDAPFTESSPYAPSSPYSASKASADHLVRAWHRTYSLPIVISNCSNNYGPYQHTEKLIPLVITHALAGTPLPIYGDGQQVRDWLFVEDHARALIRVAEQGALGATYNIGGNNEQTNLGVVYQICELLDELAPSHHTNLKSYKELITFVTDRPGHDSRYAIDTSKIRTELGWGPTEDFTSGIRKTVDWYLNNTAV